ncbi:hypothetical protein VaNZ11_016319, partial [Volvox africanus]
ALQDRIPFDAALTLEFLQTVYDIRTAHAAGMDGTAPAASTAVVAEGLAAADRLALTVLGSPPSLQPPPQPSPQAPQTVTAELFTDSGAAAAAAAAAAAVRSVPA